MNNLYTIEKYFSLLNIFALFFGIYMYLFIKDIIINKYDNILKNFYKEVSNTSTQIIIFLITILTVYVFKKSNRLTHSLAHSLDDIHLTDEELKMQHFKGSILFALLGLIVGFLGKIGIWGLNFFIVFIIYYYVNPNKFIKMI